MFFCPDHGRKRWSAADKGWALVHGWGSSYGSSSVRRDFTRSDFTECWFNIQQQAAVYLQKTWICTFRLQ